MEKNKTHKYLSVLKRQENIQGIFKDLEGRQNKKLELNSTSENNKIG